MPVGGWRFFALLVFKRVQTHTRAGKLFVRVRLRLRGQKGGLRLMARWRRGLSGSSTYFERARWRHHPRTPFATPAGVLAVSHVRCGSTRGPPTLSTVVTSAAAPPAKGRGPFARASKRASERMQFHTAQGHREELAFLRPACLAGGYRVSRKSSSHFGHRGGRPLLLLLLLLLLAEGHPGVSSLHCQFPVVHSGRAEKAEPPFFPSQNVNPICSQGNR